MGGDLLSRTEARRVATLAELDAGTQARLGQFFTPERAAQLIASMPILPESGVLRVLDPGAGVGSLSAALVNRVLAGAPNVAIEVTAVEVDPRVAPQLRATMADCEASAARVGRQVSTKVVIADFIESSVGFLAQRTLQGPFDIVVMNPPYAKLGTDSPHRRALVAYGVDCPNLYAAFMALGIGALAAGGQLVAITPRSFANGPYFERFRRHLLGSIAVNRVHTFESRSTVFSDTGVLQENIVLAGTRQGEQGPVVLSRSVGHNDDATESVVPYEAIVLPDDPHRFLRVADDATDGVVVELMAQMPATLGDLGLGVSTGRVVDFRLRESLRDVPGEGCAPLIYPTVHSSQRAHRTRGGMASKQVLDLNNRAVFGGVAGTCPWDPSRLGVGYDTMWISFTSEPVEAEETRPIDHIGFFTSELDATSARLEEIGAPFPIPPRPFNTVRLAFFEDPGGIWVELVELPGGRIPK